MNPPGKTDHISVHQFKIPRRTEGDGMEKEEINMLDKTEKSVEKVLLRDQLIYRPVDLKECSMPATPVTGKIINLIPKVKVSNRKNSFNVKFSKEPKFVPYEPYKAATNPMFSEDKTHAHKPIKLLNDVSTNVENLVGLNKLHISVVTKGHGQDKGEIDVKKESRWEEEKRALLEEVSRLKTENLELENQVKFQAQVNGEVKKLLVAAVGEDIETRVQLLTEDKLHLAKQLLNTAKTLSTHQEQIEWLAGQCEVWRSKFLASSILVEDLARWKAGLCQKVSDYQNALQQLLKDKDVLRQNVFNTFINLSTLQEKFNLDQVAEENSQRQLISSNIIELCASNRHLSDLLMAQLLHEDIARKKKPFELDPVEYLTCAEKYAEQVLIQPVVSFEHTDLACNAVMTGAALAMTSSPHCSHCNGIIKTI